MLAKEQKVTVYYPRDREPMLQGSICVDSGKEVTEEKGETSAIAHCSPGYKSPGEPQSLGEKKAEKLKLQRRRAEVCSKGDSHWVPCLVSIYFLGSREEQTFFQTSQCLSGFSRPVLVPSTTQSLTCILRGLCYSLIPSSSHPFPGAPPLCVHHLAPTAHDSQFHLSFVFW